MLIEINPRSLLNLENICEVLYKLHPSVLEELVEMERYFGKILGIIDLDNVSIEERELLANVKEVVYSEEPTQEESKVVKVNETNEKSELLRTIQEMKEEKNNISFNNLRKYLQLDSYEYIPIKISVEVEDPVIGRKVKELVEALENTRAPEQFYYLKREMDEDAYFAEGYGLTMNEEQKKQRDDFFYGEDVEGLERLLRKENLYP